MFIIRYALICQQMTRRMTASLLFHLVLNRIEVFLHPLFSTSHLISVMFVYSCCFFSPFSSCFCFLPPILLFNPTKKKGKRRTLVAMTSGCHAAAESSRGLCMRVCARCSMMELGCHADREQDMGTAI